MPEEIATPVNYGAQYVKVVELDEMFKGHEVTRDGEKYLRILVSEVHAYLYMTDKGTYGQM
jgi:hypothetical protein